MGVKRRTLIGGLGAGGVALATGGYFWPEDGLVNPCLGPDLPDRLRRHALVAAAWEGLDAQQVWDGHVHLIGTGDGGSGIWVSEQMQSPWHPVQYAQFRLYFNAACVSATSGIDQAFVDRVVWSAGAFPDGVKLLLLAFDHTYDEQGRRRLDQSAFHTPNAYARRIAGLYPSRVEWCASIHPYREDCIEALQEAVAGGARGVKWLPPAMGVDPASPRCDRFYDALAGFDLPLLSHAGRELAVHGADRQSFGNPLRLRRALERGVRVIVSHCGAMGRGIDLDQGERGPKRSNFDLFARLLGEPEYEERLFGEISAMNMINRIGEPLRRVIRERDWQPRLLNASDYPLPGLMPLFSLKQMVRLGFLAQTDLPVLLEIRRYNPLLFDFLVKRRLRVDGLGFDDIVFETRRVFERAR
jgi:mannonate dehydratase